MSNLPTIDEVVAMAPAAVAALPVDMLEAISQEIGATEAVAKAARAALTAGVVLKFPKLPGVDPWGTDRHSVDGLDVVLSTPKNVSWDNAKLAEAERIIRDEWEGDPADYVETKRTVAEASFKAWPKPVKALFEPARTVKPGATKVTFERKAAAV